jgi:pimeloyl-ACP methyl ester carboxylesterase
MMQEFLSDGVEIAFIDVAPEGSDLGEPILLIHGFASSHRINWVDPQWVATLTKAGRRVIALDNRGHGNSEKPHDASAYRLEALARDAANLLDHLAIRQADVMGYSMGARISCFLGVNNPGRVRAMILGGLGAHLFENVGPPLQIAEAMEAPSLEGLTDPMQRLFRGFAEQNKSDLAALAACMRGSRQTLSRAEIGGITCPVLVAVGTRDEIAGDPHRLAKLFPHGEALDIPGRDHNRAVGDRIFKAAVLEFLQKRP